MSSARVAFPKPPGLIAVLLVFVCLLEGAIVLSRLCGETPAIWVANGVLLGALLVVPSQRFAGYLLICLLADFALNEGRGDHLLLSFILAICKLAEVAIAYGLLRGRFGARPDPARPGALVRLAVTALTAPVFPAIFAADARFYLADEAFAKNLVDWYAASALGFMIVTPLILALFRPRRPAPPAAKQFFSAFRYFAFLAAVCVVVFSQSRYPLRFLVFPPLLLIAGRRSLVETAAATLFAALTILGFTVAGHGPISLLAQAEVLSQGEKLRIAQGFVFILGLCALALAARTEQTRRLREILAARQARLRESERRYRALADNSSDAIYRMAIDGRRLYVSPAAQEMFGFSPEEQVGRHWREDVHPEDWPAVKVELRKLAAGSDTVVFSYRRRCKNGRFVWVETRVRAVRDRESGVVGEYIASSRDISRQKSTEEKLNAANAALVALAATDGLTGIANRRSFDEALEREWRRGQREQTALALLMIDVDHFKPFNDFYGHLVGDDCLRRLAATIKGCLHRPGDLAARFGGEEFAVLLPTTDAVGALEIAERIHDAVAALDIVHEVIPLGRISLSIGIASDGPERYHSAKALLQTADRALYLAKHEGRNRSVIAVIDDLGGAAGHDIAKTR